MPIIQSFQVTSASSRGSTRLHAELASNRTNQKYKHKANRSVGNHVVQCVLVKML